MRGGPSCTNTRDFDASLVTIVRSMGDYAVEHFLDSNRISKFLSRTESQSRAESCLQNPDTLRRLYYTVRPKDQISLK